MFGGDSVKGPVYVVLVHVTVTFDNMNVLLCRDLITDYVLSSDDVCRCHADSIVKNGCC